MGYSQADKAETHQRIVEVAARRFRELGLEGISVADLMKEAGLTVGGFYKHFASRDDLVVEALQLAFQDSVSGTTLDKTIEAYLSETHRDTLHSACGIATLVNDISRSSDDAREALTRRLELSITSIEQQIPDEVGGDRMAKALVIYSAMVGAMSMSRAIVDPKISEHVLNAVATELISLFCPTQKATP